MPVLCMICSVLASLSQLHRRQTLRSLFLRFLSY